MEPPTVTDRVNAYTQAIQNAREALSRADTPAAREALKEAERAYRAFLMTLNGIAG